LKQLASKRIEKNNFVNDNDDNDDSGGVGKYRNGLIGTAGRYARSRDSNRVWLPPRAPTTTKHAHTLSKAGDGSGAVAVEDAARWYDARARRIERETGRVDYAATLLHEAGVQLRSSLCRRIDELNVLVYGTDLDTTLDEYEALNDQDRLSFVFKSVRKGFFVRYTRTHTHRQTLTQHLVRYHCLRFHWQ
jgi:hypothetical protein